MYCYMCGCFCEVGLGSGGKVVLVFHGPQRIEWKRSTVRERKRKMDGEREVCLWLVTRSREEIPVCARTHTHTHTHTHRCKNIESRDASERIKTCFVWATGFGVYMCVRLCTVCVCVCGSSAEGCWESRVRMQSGEGGGRAGQEWRALSVLHSPKAPSL